MKNEKCSPKDFSFFVFHFPITPCGHERKEQNGEEPHVPTPPAGGETTP
ncbi:hypothetical protein TFKS16_1055 [Tannerella forsythia KS16]|uniref:Uncharacterized protein n=1 Tax=Tannerella forsythia (strain ATCC 43037 / JCM 10827 / CCUG 21028 A / KCTC 5666 / FDC 338) TaxID=203275 RepID=G8UHT4_TANFA|nr:hypothetical protein BFO_1102 [Tannerella forsythia 92A2]BAR51332.1 hypothetical protein TFKS16_1055 [Tannerella forsythia KS16]